MPAFRLDGPAGLPSEARLAAGALIDLALEDPSLHAATLGKSSHVRLDTGAGGELALHMRVEDGIVDVRVEGAAARTLDIRPDELRTALAGEGISLGHFESVPSHVAYLDGPAGSSADATGAGGNTAAGGGQTPSSHSGPGFGGNRHFEAGDRWPDREPSSAPGARPPGAGSTAARTSSDDPDSDDDRGRRRGFHVTA
jgi:hypothetical protein